MKIYDKDYDKKIEIIKGDTAEFYVEVEDYEFQSGDTLNFIVRKTADDTTNLISKTIAATSPITLTTSETNALDYGTYQYVIRLNTVDSQRITIVEPSTFEVKRW